MRKARTSEERMHGNIKTIVDACLRMTPSNVKSYKEQQLGVVYEALDELRKLAEEDYKTFEEYADKARTMLSYNNVVLNSK